MYVASLSMFLKFSDRGTEGPTDRWTDALCKRALAFLAQIGMSWQKILDTDDFSIVFFLFRIPRLTIDDEITVSEMKFIRKDH